MSSGMPEVIRRNGFDFDWDEREIWRLALPVEEMPVAWLDWHFDLPFWDNGDQAYGLAARDVMARPADYPAHWARVQQAEVGYPIDVALHPVTGRWVILDGLHRLVRLAGDGAVAVRVRKVPLALVKKR
jgi:hypothetical protein